jgi:spermidine synthase
MKAQHSIEASEESGVRFLHFGSEWVQGAMRIARPYALELEYTREMMACVLLRGYEGAGEDWPKTVLQIGLGAASLTKFWHRYFPDTMQTIVEINPAVVAMAYQSFKLPRDEERIEIHTGDGVAWINESKQKFDCIMVDGYDQHARFGALGTEAFYRDCRARLTRRGLLVLNLFGRSRGYRQQLDSLHEVFNDRVLALPPIESAPGASDGGNAIVFAAVGETMAMDPQTLREGATRLEKLTGLKLARTVMRLEHAECVIFSGCINKKSNTSTGAARGKKMPQKAREY